MKIEWTSQYNLGIEKIDEQHQWLVKLYNNIENAFSRKQSAEILGTYLKGLLHYTRFHFSSEEADLISFNYQYLEEHKAMHDLFIKKINAYLKEFDQGNEQVVAEVLQFLSNWLQNHILVEDKKYISEYSISNLMPSQKLMAG